MEAGDGTRTTMELSSASTTLFQDESFIWDEASQLYYHPRSGFYHDPNAGWYYSSIDGLYYTYEDGKYVLLDTNKGCQSEIHGSGELSGNNEETQEEHDEGEDCHVDNDQCSLIQEDDRSNQNDYTSDGQAIEIPPPTSDWLEETLIDMYLSEKDDDHKQKDDEEEEVSWEEENWRAQYGQVVPTEEETTPEVSTVDIWDWGVIREPEKEIPVARLVGRLVKPSAKLHPSMPSGGGWLRTAPICEVHLDLVRVKTGQVYRLRSPSAGHLTTVSSYDSSNPTKDWGFPELSVENKIIPFLSNTDSKEVLHLTQNKSHGYRDRAAERRALHGGFGIGPGQKKTTLDGSPSSSPPSSTQEAAAEALEMSLGAGSYAQKILKNMGWKEGEALGRTKQGLTKPLVAVGNKGNAGLGWHLGQIKHP
ncbi:LOW QUALITY PROTEIN: hypothetical protein V2J09_006844 [Rumex salicifolius]